MINLLKSAAQFRVAFLGIMSLTWAPHYLSAATETPANITSTETQAVVASEIDLNNATAESLSSLRDPFQRPKFKEYSRTIPDLEKYPIDQYELLGVITGPYRMRAMVRDPNQKTHLVSVKTRIGNRSGVIKKITPVSLVVREKILNVFGREESSETELRLIRPKGPDGQRDNQGKPATEEGTEGAKGGTS